MRSTQDNRFDPILRATILKWLEDNATIGGGTGGATEATLTALLTELQAKADLVETQPVSLSGVPLPTGASTEATLALLLSYVDPLAKYAIARGDSAGALEYWGFLANDGSWYILRITKAITDTYEYINGAANFGTAWTNRVGLSYVEFDTLTW